MLGADAASTIPSQQTRRAVGAHRAAIAAAVDVAFVLVRHPIATARRPADRPLTAAAQAIARHRTARAARASPTRAATAIHVRFPGIHRLVATSFGRAARRGANVRVAIGVGSAHHPDRARLAIGTAAIEVRFRSIQDAIVAGGRIAAAFTTLKAVTILVESAAVAARAALGRASLTAVHVRLAAVSDAIRAAGCRAGSSQADAGSTVERDDTALAGLTGPASSATVVVGFTWIFEAVGAMGGRRGVGDHVLGKRARQRERPRSERKAERGAPRATSLHPISQANHLSSAAAPLQRRTPSARVRHLPLPPSTGEKRPRRRRLVDRREAREAFAPRFVQAPAGSASPRQRGQNRELHVAQRAVVEPALGRRLDFEAVARAARDGANFTSHDAHTLGVQGRADCVQ